MPSWLTKTIQAISQVTEPEPVPFELTCYCGEIFDGERTRHSQVIQCRSCGERLFLYPANVYPQPKQRTPSKRDSANKNKADRRTDSSPKKKDRNTKQDAKATLEIAQKETKVVQKESLPTTLDSLPIPRRKLLTPLRLVIASIGITLVLTSWWLIHSYQQDQAIDTLRLSVEAGETALEEDDLILAEEEFGKAAQAADVLKRDDIKSRRVQQMHKELIVVNHLSRLALFELITDLESKYNTEHPEIWNNHFQRYYKNNWVIVEAEVSRENEASYSLLLDRQKKKREGKKDKAKEDSSDPQRYVVHSPLDIQDYPLVLSVNLSQLDNLSFEGSAETILFAGQLRRCELLDSSDPTWVIDFVPKSTLLWSNEKLLMVAGFPLTTPEEKERIKTILNKQTQLLEGNE